MGVHENTVRRWADRGLIQPVRLPSGVRRFRAEDVERLKATMFSGLAPIEDVDEDVVTLSRRPGGRSID